VAKLTAILVLPIQFVVIQLLHLGHVLLFNLLEVEIVLIFFH
jgi:hypothetical protein